MKTKNLRKLLPSLLLMGALVGCTEQASFDHAQAIQAYTRDTTSGTRDGFMTKIGIEKAKNDDSLFKAKVQTVSSNGDMIGKIAADEYGIGYFSFSSVPDAEKQGVKVLNFEGVKATEDAILDGSYKLSRNFNYCTQKQEDEDATKWTIISAFIAFMTTSEGIADIVGADGIVKVPSDVKKWNDIKGNYPGIEDDHSKITIRFGGSTSCEKVAKALSADFSKRAGNFVAEHNHKGSGDAYKGTQGANRDFDVAYASREFSSSEPLAEGTFGKVCTDGIVVGVNQKNDLANITADQAKNIYSKDGTITTWADIK